MSVNCRFIPIFTVPKKFQEKYKKISVPEDSGSPKESRRGAPPSQAGRWRGPTLGRARRPPGWRGPPLVPPFGLDLHLVLKTLERNPVTRFHLLFRRRGDSDLGIARRTCPGTLPEGGLTSGGLSITMIASGMRRE